MGVTVGVVVIVGVGVGVLVGVTQHIPVFDFDEVDAGISKLF